MEARGPGGEGRAGLLEPRKPLEPQLRVWGCHGERADAFSPRCPRLGGGWEQSRSHALEWVITDRGGYPERQEFIQGKNRVPSKRPEEAGIGPGSEIPGAPRGTVAELEEKKVQRKFQVEETVGVKVGGWKETSR